MTVDVAWHVRALRPLHRIHFYIGDYAILEQQRDDTDIVNTFVLYIMLGGSFRAANAPELLGRSFQAANTPELLGTARY
uniref:DUF772 domain-containing protein n=1 Tax=Angiostrongylus cantonensis TaxID=6313 RepID=A0A0K0CYV9_ANGCA